MASFTVRNVQYAVFNLGWTEEVILANGCPKDPNEVEPDPVLRRLKAVLTHPIGDYAVQPRDATWAAHGITQAHYLSGASYTVGATQNISIRSTSMVREFGGEVLVDATIKEIIIEKGRAVGVRVCNTSALAECIASAEEGKKSPPLTEIRAKMSFARPPFTISTTSFFLKICPSSKSSRTPPRGRFVRATATSSCSARSRATPMRSVSRLTISGILTDMTSTRSSTSTLPTPPKFGLQPSTLVSLAQKTLLGRSDFPV